MMQAMVQVGSCTLSSSNDSKVSSLNTMDVIIPLTVSKYKSNPSLETCAAGDPRDQKGVVSSSNSPRC